MKVIGHHLPLWGDGKKTKYLQPPKPFEWRIIKTNPLVKTDTFEIFEIFQLQVALRALLRVDGNSDNWEPGPKETGMKSDEVYLRDIWMDERPKDVDLGVLRVTTSLDVQNMCLCVCAFIQKLARKTSKTTPKQCRKVFPRCYKWWFLHIFRASNFAIYDRGWLFPPIHPLRRLTKSPTVWAPERATMSLSSKPWEGWKSGEDHVIQW